MLRINAVMSGKIAAFIPARRLMIFLLNPAAFIRGKGVYLNIVAGVTQSPFAELSELKQPNKVKYFLN